MVMMTVVIMSLDHGNGMVTMTVVMVVVMTW
jgi:hypothetical protein